LKKNTNSPMKKEQRPLTSISGWLVIRSEPPDYAATDASP
jgi:hypothetical protein